MLKFLILSVLPLAVAPTPRKRKADDSFSPEPDEPILTTQPSARAQRAARRSLAAVTTPVVTPRMADTVDEAMQQEALRGFSTPELRVDEAIDPRQLAPLPLAGPPQEVIEGTPREGTMDVIRKYWDYLPMSAKIALGASAVVVPAAAYAYNRYMQKPKVLRKTGSRLRDPK